MDKNTKFGFEGRIFDGYNELVETKSISGNTNGNKDIVVVGKEHGNGAHSGTELYDIDRHKNIEWLKFSDGYYDTQNDIFHANPFVPDLGEVPEPIPTIDAAIEKVNTFMGKNGALGNAVERIISNNINTLLSIKKAKSSITDANIALESAELVKHNLLLSSQSKFGQIINASKNTILGLIAKDTLVYKQPFSYS